MVGLQESPKDPAEAQPTPHVRVSPRSLQAELGIVLSSVVGLRPFVVSRAGDYGAVRVLGIALSSTVRLRLMPAQGDPEEPAQAWNCPEKFGGIATFPRSRLTNPMGSRFKIPWNAELPEQYGGIANG